MIYDAYFSRFFFYCRRRLSRESTFPRGRARTRAHPDPSPSPTRNTTTTRRPRPRAGSGSGRGREGRKGKRPRGRGDRGPPCPSKFFFFFFCLSVSYFIGFCDTQPGICLCDGNMLSQYALIEQVFQPEFLDRPQRAPTRPADQGQGKGAHFFPFSLSPLNLQLSPSFRNPLYESEILELLSCSLLLQRTCV